MLSRFNRFKKLFSPKEKVPTHIYLIGDRVKFVSKIEIMGDEYTFTHVGYISDIRYTKGADKTKGLLYRVNGSTNGVCVDDSYLDIAITSWCDCSELARHAVGAAIFYTR